MSPGRSIDEDESQNDWREVRALFAIASVTEEAIS